MAFELRNKKITKHLTPNAFHFLEIIANYTGSTFSKGESILMYALNLMGDNGTSIFISDIKNL